MVRREFLAANPQWRFFLFDRVTVGIRRTGITMGEFTISIASADEKKIRRKVGEYNAIQRIADGIILPVVLGEYDEHFTEDDILESTCYDIANAVSLA